MSEVQRHYEDTLNAIGRGTGDADLKQFVTFAKSIGLDAQSLK